jgi:SAM-dependent methyltransferase
VAASRQVEVDTVARLKLSTIIRRAPKIARNAAHDLRYGRPLGGTIRTRYAHLGANDVGNADYEDLALLFAGIPVRPGDVIVDVGCGKGRSLNWFLDRYRGNRIVGIELDPAICAATKKRLRRHANVEILCGDATALLPPDGTVFYLFNPFDESVTRRFAEAMLDRGDPATIVYLNAKHTVAFEGDPRFTVAPIAPPGLSFRSVLVTVR